MSKYCKCEKRQGMDDDHNCDDCGHPVNLKSKVRHACLLILAELDASENVLPGQGRNPEDPTWQAWRKAAWAVERDDTANRMAFAAIGFCLNCKKGIKGDTPWATKGK